MGWRGGHRNKTNDFICYNSIQFSSTSPRSRSPSSSLGSIFSKISRYDDRSFDELSSRWIGSNWRERLEIDTRRCWKPQNVRDSFVLSDELFEFQFNFPRAELNWRTNFRHSGSDGWWWVFVIFIELVKKAGNCIYTCIMPDVDVDDGWWWWRRWWWWWCREIKK